MGKIKALFLDRDDTIIRNIPYMSRVEDIVYLPHVFEKIKSIQDLGYKVFIVTNQSGLARDLIGYSELEAIHRKMREDFARRGIRLIKFYISPYKFTHPRRKPGAGLLEEAAIEYSIDLGRSVMIGDGIRDIMAGQNAGVYKTFQVKDIFFWGKLPIRVFI